MYLGIFCLWSIPPGAMLAYDSSVNDTCCDVCGPTEDEVLTNLITAEEKRQDIATDLKGKFMNGRQFK